MHVVPPGVDTEAFRPDGGDLAALVERLRADAAAPHPGRPAERAPDPDAADRLAGRRPVRPLLRKAHAPEGRAPAARCVGAARAAVSRHRPRGRGVRGRPRRARGGGSGGHHLHRRDGSRPPAPLVPLADAVVVPSVLPEAFGMVAAEAAACGVVPIVAGHSGLAEVAAALGPNGRTFDGTAADLEARLGGDAGAAGAAAARDGRSRRARRSRSGGAGRGSPPPGRPQPALNAARCVAESLKAPSRGADSCVVAPRLMHRPAAPRPAPSRAGRRSPSGPASGLLGDAVFDAVFVHVDGRIVEVNRRSRRRSATRREEALGLTVFDIFAADTTTWWWSAIRHESPERYELVGVTRAGEGRHMEVCGAPSVRVGRARRRRTRPDRAPARRGGGGRACLSVRRRPDRRLRGRPAGSRAPPTRPGPARRSARAPSPCATG